MISQKNGEQTSVPSEQITDNEALYQELRKKCGKYSLFPMLPKSLPQDLKILSFEQQSLTKRETLAIVLGNKKSSIIMNIDFYLDKNTVPIIKIPNSSDIGKISIHGENVYLSTENNKISSIFNYGNYVYKYSSTLSYDETVDVLQSLH